ncbi:23S rRNA pseudouridine1911/1915/1917 synthase [Thermonema lapsum]|uniref:Pseudouridine synthase n=1 Tax=Thermonema lapsum TaxID=28195 RepID=A0A846MPT9_9BACT|nr:RluA family pseudouridine synthase [Thermonema lapsum]NIK73479.1 23S rRNA pseudouridine1911/1915/1917 synthase [Thermonema lapsum]
MQDKSFIEEEELDLYEHHKIVVDKGQKPLRIDKYLMERLANATRTKIQNAIHAEFVKVNDKTIKPNYKVRPLDVITVCLPEPPRTDEILPENLPLDIVYEDDDLLVINKPAGMVVHPAYQNWSGTLVNALMYHFENLPTSQNGSMRPGLVHRIDKDTSGLLVVAKTELAMTFLAKQFYDHTIERKYYALVWGVPNPPQGTVANYIGRSPKDRRVMTVLEEGEGKYAVTHYKVIEDLRYVSLIECRLETGRTHQIRVHMQHLGHPLFNDAAYGGDKILRGTSFSKYKQFVENCFSLLPRQALHAASLGFVHPRTKEKLYFEQALPEDMQAVLDKWRRYVQYE